jgi:hypothetical protein
MLSRVVSPPPKTMRWQFIATSISLSGKPAQHEVADRRMPLHAGDRQHDTGTAVAPAGQRVEHISLREANRSGARYTAKASA